MNTHFNVRTTAAGRSDGAMWRMIRRICAIAAGFVLAALLSRGTDLLFEGTGVFPPVTEQQKSGFSVFWMNALALSYRICFAALGGVVTAVMSPDCPMRHVHVLGIISVVVSIIANIAVAMIPATVNVLPLWFSIAMVLTAYPSVWLGGRLYFRWLSRRNSTDGR